MIRSMTAFARRERQGPWGVLVWELRSLNHRYLEVSTRLPEELRALETVVRERVGRRLGRGKVECALRFRSNANAVPELRLAEDSLARLLAACRTVEERLGQSTPPTALDLLRWPGVVQDAEADLGPVQEAAAELLDEALAELLETRGREGAQIRDLLLPRCAAMEELAAQARAHLPEVRARLRDKLQARLAELAVEADPGRVEQELVMLAQKMDVDEELDRLQGHVQEVRRVLERREPVGRRLDFLMQELNREANTLGSKSADADTTRVSVELKVLIEQMREQVQNVE